MLFLSRMEGQLPTRSQIGVAVRRALRDRAKDCSENRLYTAFGAPPTRDSTWQLRHG